MTPERERLVRAVEESRDAIDAAIVAETEASLAKSQAKLAWIDGIRALAAYDAAHPEEVK